MRTLSIFDIQDINALLIERKLDYLLKLKDACGNQSLSLECTGKEVPIQEICDVINSFLKNKHIEVQPGSINPSQLLIK